MNQMIKQLTSADLLTAAHKLAVDRGQIHQTNTRDGATNELHVTTTLYVTIPQLETLLAAQKAPDAMEKTKRRKR